MYRSDPFSCPEHLTGISEAGIWSPLEKAAMMRASVGITGAAHPLTHPAYQQALANWRPNGATDSMNGARGTRPRSLSAVLEAAASAPMGEATYFTVGAVLGWWKIRTSKTGQRATFTLEGSDAQVRCVMWSNSLKRHHDIPKDGDLVVAVGRIQTRSFTRTEVDEATGEEVTTTHYRHEAVIDRLSTVGDPIRGALSAAEIAWRGRDWWNALDAAGQADAIRRHVGFARPASPDLSRKGLIRLEAEPLPRIGEEPHPGGPYAAGVALALGILRQCKAATWHDLVAAMNAVEENDSILASATPEQQVIADRFGTIVLSDEDWSLLAVAPLEFLSMSPRYSIAVCSDCGHAVDAGPKGMPRKCTAVPFCEGALSKKVTPAKAEKVAPSAPTPKSEPEQSVTRGHLSVVPAPAAATLAPGEVLPCDVLVIPMPGMSSFRPVLFRRDGTMGGEVGSDALKRFAHVMPRNVKSAEFPPDALVVPDPEVYRVAMASMSSRTRPTLADFPDLVATIRVAHRVIHEDADCYRNVLTVVP